MNDLLKEFVVIVDRIEEKRKKGISVSSTFGALDPMKNKVSSKSQTDFSSLFTDFRVLVSKDKYNLDNVIEALNESDLSETSKNELKKISDIRKEIDDSFNSDINYAGSSEYCNLTNIEALKEIESTYYSHRDRKNSPLVKKCIKLGINPDNTKSEDLHGTYMHQVNMMVLSYHSSFLGFMKKCALEVIEKSEPYYRKPNPNFKFDFDIFNEKNSTE